MGRTPFPAPRHGTRPDPRPPLRDCAPYDFLVTCPQKANSGQRDHHGHFLRVQVKCTLYKRDNSYQCCLTANHNLYTPAQIDFFAAYVIPVDVFYILPLAATNNQPDITLSPHLKKSKYGPYQEAWHLLMTQLPFAGSDAVKDKPRKP